MARAPGCRAAHAWSVEPPSPSRTRQRAPPRHHAARLRRGTTRSPPAPRGAHRTTVYTFTGWLLFLSSIGGIGFMRGGVLSASLKSSLRRISPASRRAAQSARRVDGVADHRVLEAALAPDVARERLAEVEPDADLHRRSARRRPARVELVEGEHHVERRVHRAVRVVALAERRAPLRHDRVADELVERAAVAEHALHHLGEVLGEQLGHRVRVHRLRERGEPADVGEEHGHGALVAAELHGVGAVRRCARRGAA